MNVQVSIVYEVNVKMLSGVRMWRIDLVGGGSDGPRLEPTLFGYSEPAGSSAVGRRKPTG
jgi:hypothetical protein